MTDKQLFALVLEYIEANADSQDEWDMVAALKARLEQPEEKYTYGTPLLDAFTKPAPESEKKHD